MTWVDTYFAALCRKVPDASERVSFLEVRFDDGSQPTRNKCHENVDRWVKNNPQYWAVRGWAVNGNGGYYLLDAHSVVCDERGALWDITFPDLAAHGLLFIRHWGAADEFTRVRAQREQHICL